MFQDKREHPAEKPKLHPRNRHRARYDFKELIAASPELAPFVQFNIHEDESIDFFNPKAVLALNRALLKCYYDIAEWAIPPGYLCPPIPGRADYIHHIADLLGSKNGGQIPVGPQVKCLDVGVGANCVYPIIGIKEYGWSFIGSEIDPVALEAAGKIIEANPALQGKLELRLQPNRKEIFFGIIQTGERIDLSICNPPFHTSLEEAKAASMRKVSNLKGKKITNLIPNFGGQNTELWCPGGETKFVGEMIRQSAFFAKSCFWFSTLISKESHYRAAMAALKTAKASGVKTIAMGQGNKSSRLLAWTFLQPAEQKAWVAERFSSVVPEPVEEKVAEPPKRPARKKKLAVEAELDRI